MFSIIIPTCNRNESLSICLDYLYNSVNAISEVECEVIVTDDGNKDQAKALLENKYIWVKWLKGPKKGPAANRNNGAKIASGKWLLFLDDDCIPSSSLLLAYHDFIIANPSILVIEGSILPEGERKSSIDYAPINTTGGHLWSCNFCINRDFFNSLNGFDENYIFPHMEDMDLRKRISNRSVQFIFCINAAVIHPYRKIKDGFRLGKYQEMYVLYHKKFDLELSFKKLIQAIVYFHLSMIKRAIQFTDPFIALKLLGQHLFVVCLNYRKWVKKY